MRLQVLGSASSQGIPQPFCNCLICSKASGKDKRLRSSYLVKLKSGKSILLDISPDFTHQQQKTNFDLDCAFISHKHRDHTNGLGDIRIALEAHDSKRAPSQKQRTFLVGKKLNNWLSNGKRDMRWEESVQQAYQQLVNRKHFKRVILTPYRQLKLDSNTYCIYLKGKHGDSYCGGLVIVEGNKKLIYLADISNFNDQLIRFINSQKPNLVIAHVPFFYKSKNPTEAARHPGLEDVVSLPTQKILISHFSHKANLSHKEMDRIVKKTDPRILVAYDNQELIL